MPTRLHDVISRRVRMYRGVYATLRPAPPVGGRPRARIPTAWSLSINIARPRPINLPPLRQDTCTTGRTRRRRPRRKGDRSTFDPSYLGNSCDEYHWCRCDRPRAIAPAGTDPSCAENHDVTVFLSEPDEFPDCWVDKSRRARSRAPSYPSQFRIPVHRMHSAARGVRQARHLIVLGDLPLRSSVDQVVYVHQPHLVSPRIDNNSSRLLRHRVARLIFRFNARYAQCFVVQTEAMHRKMTATYEAVRGKVWVIAAPPPAGFVSRRTRSANPTTDCCACSIRRPRTRTRTIDCWPGCRRTTAPTGPSTN